MARMTIDRAVEILSEASQGRVVSNANNAEFKVACAMGKEALVTLRAGEILLNRIAAAPQPRRRR